MDILAARKKAAERSREQKPENLQHPPEQPAPQQEFRMPEQAVEAPAAASEATITPPALVEAVLVAPTPDAASAPQTAPDPAQEEPAQDEELEMLSFRLGNEEYAVHVEDVREVLKNRELTRVPNAPDYMLGVMALRGPVLPVIDLSKRLGLPSGDRDEKSRILIVTVQEEDAGLVVDRVTGVVKISRGSVRPVPETAEGGSAFLRGIARKGEKLYILLDIEKVLAA